MAGVHRIYDQYARTYDKDRNRSLMERSYLREVISRLRKRAHVLDLGRRADRPFLRRGRMPSHRCRCGAGLGQSMSRALPPNDLD